MQVDFTSGPATSDGGTAGDPAPRSAAYDVANTDFFDDLDPFIPGETRDFSQVDPREVIQGRQGLGGLDSLVLADDAMPGYTGRYGGGGDGTPSGGPTPDSTFEGRVSVPGAGEQVPGTYEEHPFTIKRNEGNARVTVRIDWEFDVNDFDMTLRKVESNGDHTVVGESASAQGSTNFEQIVLENPAPGDYVVHVDNWASADPRYTGSIKFEPKPGGGQEINTGAFSVAEKDAWMNALADYARGGGNLVLTDGALEALPDLAGVDADSVDRSTVYAGQTAFETADGEDTLDDKENPEPLTRDIAQEGARFGSGNRRQTFEPTPLGFAIQNEAGGDDSNARQFDVRRKAWEDVGGRIAGTSVSSSPDAAAPVHNRVTLGELKLGEGQIRIAGSLLPQPTEAFDHTLGLEPYAPTYTGYILMRNLLDAREKGGGEAPGAGRCGNVVVGDAKRNKLKGTSGEDRIRGKGGRDAIKGRGGNDCLNGGGGRDKIAGNGGNDQVAGGEGSDRLVGGAGNDRLKGGDKRDKIAGGKGKDRINAKRGRKDKVDCGKGKDVAVVDKRDKVRRCEKVRGAQTAG
jgi:Ca2+-binding RTX toxin-like protein